MARRIKQLSDQGLGKKFRKEHARLVKVDGSSNVLFENLPLTLDNLYAYLISMSWARFFSYVTLGYIILNSFFALIYMWIGVEELSVGDQGLFNNFVNAFYFSAQTITTVGYGAIAPSGVIAGFISSFQALIGLLSFSFITGLLWGRFSKPKSSVHFSKQMIIRPFKEKRALMFRLMNSRRTVMIEPEITSFISVKTKTKTGISRKYFPVNLELSKITYLPNMWTVVHMIDADSYFYEMRKNQILESEAEIFIMLKYHDESYSSQVYQIHHYDITQTEFNVQFVPSFTFSPGGRMIVNYEDLSKTMPIDSQNESEKTKQAQEK